MPFEKGNKLGKRERLTKDIRKLRTAGYEEMIKAISCVLMPNVYDKIMHENLFKEIDPKLLELVEHIREKAFSDDPKAMTSLNFLFDRLVGKPDVNMNINQGDSDNSFTFKFPEKQEKEIQGELLDESN